MMVDVTGLQVEPPLPVVDVAVGVLVRVAVGPPGVAVRVGVLVFTGVLVRVDVGPMVDVAVRVGVLVIGAGVLVRVGVFVGPELAPGNTRLG